MDRFTHTFIISANLPTTHPVFSHPRVWKLTWKAHRIRSPFDAHLIQRDLELFARAFQIRHTGSKVGLLIDFEGSSATRRWGWFEIRIWKSDTHTCTSEWSKISQSDDWLKLQVVDIRNKSEIAPNCIILAQRLCNTRAFAKMLISLNMRI